jgi:hypothetical protein
MTKLNQCSRWADNHSASKKFPASYGAWSFITLFMGVRRRTLSWSSYIHSILSHTALRRLGLSSYLFLSGIPLKWCINFLPFLRKILVPSLRPPWFDYPNNTLRRVQIVKLLTLKCSSATVLCPSILWALLFRKLSSPVSSSNERVHAIAQATSHRTSTSMARVRPQVKPCGICGGKGIGFSCQFLFHQLLQAH